MWPKAISMIAAGDLPIDDIISHTFPLKDFKKGIDQVISTFVLDYIDINGRKESACHILVEATKNRNKILL